MAFFVNTGLTVVFAGCGGWLTQTCIDTCVNLTNSAYPWDETKWNEITQRIRFLEKKFNLGSQVELWHLGERNLCAYRDFHRHKSIVFINPQFFLEMTADEQEFTIAHEFAHLKTTSKMKYFTSCAILAASVILAIVLPILFPGIVIFPAFYLGGSTILGWLSRCAIRSIVSVLEERQADHEAFSLCGEKGGVSLFIKQLSKETRKWYQWTFLFLIGYLDHPSSQNRISYLKKWTQERGDRTHQPATLAAR